MPTRDSTLGDDLDQVARRCLGKGVELDALAKMPKDERLQGLNIILIQ